MTALHLELLLHAYSKAEDYPLHRSRLHYNYAHELAAQDMLVISCPDWDNLPGQACWASLRITDRGLAWLKHVLATNFPTKKVTWVF